ncbi:hypothetical protein WJX72_012344 [[Myrmecia] bisecta]|uniref:Uncharacterized protein n=1 Tax=[Myrmecia] bisecta TaxID=41462 RepID=A0AAW1PIF9_9CHLO
MSGLVYGSETPWVEAILFSEGAAQVTTVEYHPIQSSYSKLHTMHPHDLAKKFAGQQLGKYDFAVSYSSLEHAGLGRLFWFFATVRLCIVLKMAA